MGLTTNSTGYPYKPARLADSAWRIYIDYSVYDVSQDKLIRKVLSKIPGDTKREKLKNGKIIAKEITQLLANGYVLGEANKLVLPHRSLTVDQGFELGVKVRSAAGRERTQQRYRHFLNVFRKWLALTGFGKLPISEFQKPHIYGFLDWTTEVRKIGNRTRNNYAEDVRSVLSVLLERELIDRNPARGVKMFPTKSASHVAFTEEQQVILEAYLKEKDPRLFIYTRLIYYCFLRPVEILRLRVKHVDLKSRIIMVRSEMAKNRKQQPVIIPKPLIPFIQDLNLDQLHPETVLFARQLLPGDKEILRKYVSDRHRKALDKSGLYNGELTMYSWKHTGVCAAYKAGMDIKSLQNHLRHANLSETEIYLRSLGLRMDSSLMDLEW